LPLHPGVEAVVAAAGELIVQPGEEGERLGGEDVVESVSRLGEHLHAVIRVHGLCLSSVLVRNQGRAGYPARFSGETEHFSAPFP
jgi:hypothetical protein